MPPCARRGALGPNETFAALWQLRVPSLLVDQDATRPGFRCSVCGRLNVSSGPCAGRAGKATEVGDAYEEAVKDAIEQQPRSATGGTRPCPKPIRSRRWIASDTVAGTRVAT